MEMVKLGSFEKFHYINIKHDSDLKFFYDLCTYELHQYDSFIWNTLYLCLYCERFVL